MVFEKAMKIFFYSTLTIALSLVGVTIVSRTKNLTLK